MAYDAHAHDRITALERRIDELERVLHKEITEAKRDRFDDIPSVMKRSG